jgi:hypothetical protein
MCPGLLGCRNQWLCTDGCDRRAPVLELYTSRLGEVYVGRNAVDLAGAIIRPDCPGARRAGSGDCALACDVATAAMLPASMKEAIRFRVMGCSFGPPTSRKSPRPKSMARSCGKCGDLASIVPAGPAQIYADGGELARLTGAARTRSGKQRGRRLGGLQVPVGREKNHASALNHPPDSTSSPTSSSASSLSAVLSCSGVDSGSGWTMRAKIDSRPAVMPSTCWRPRRSRSRLRT